MKKIIALLLATLMLASLFACGGTEKPNGENNNTENNDTGNNNPSDTKNFGIYHDYIEGAEGIAVINVLNTTTPVSGIKNAATRWAFINNNGKYCNIYGKEYQLAATPVKLFTNENSNSSLAYWDADGNFYFGESDVKFPIPSDGSLLGYSYHQADGYTFYFLKDGGIYRSLYNHNGTASEFRQNQRVYILYNEDDLDAVEPKISECKFVAEDDHYAITLLSEDGTCYYTELSASRSDYKVDGEYIYNFISEIYENVDTIFDISYNDHLNTPVYSKNGDNNHLYFVYKNADYEECNIKVVLPAGYTTADIKKAQMDWCSYNSEGDNTAILLVEFNDGSVYYLRTEDVTSATPSASSVSLICHEKLTDLNKAGHIIAVINHSHGSDWIALMDDSCIYRIYIK
jgi:hypothetical protein